MQKSPVVNQNKIEQRMLIFQRKTIAAIILSLPLSLSPLSLSPPLSLCELG